ncbi:helix-turn-helix domain-containing protein [Flavisolibacter nicotianae]|uniref:helix-turn-helix domain-containing protein n=1 Tax=Flavisolibacter nicotianae TaxID=2364882 RepID=UPI000EB12BB0|nr:helix-turn-helix domain-containing protein [Flavisolibacter nicotianae]
MRKQKSATEFGFDRYVKGRLQKVIAQVKGKRTYIRLRAVQMVVEGQLISDVAQLWDITIRVLYNWIKTYLTNHQPQSLFDKPRAGRPRVAMQLTDNRIAKELKRSPMRLGYFVNTWTVATLADHLNKRYGCAITPRTLYRRMKAMGLECKRPKYFYEEKDPNRTQKKGRSSES